jgi:hypothetical protein
MSNSYLMEIMAVLTPKQRQAVHDAFMLLAHAGRQISDAGSKQ